MDTEAVDGSPADLSDDTNAKRSTSADPAYSEAPLWPEPPVDDHDDQRTHRKRGPKRGRAGSQPKRQREVSDVALEEEVGYSGEQRYLSTMAL